MAFAKDMVKIRKELKKHGHNARIPVGTLPHLRSKLFVDDLKKNLEFCIKNNIMKRNFREVEKSDAILVLNNKRNGINGYIGISALLEMGIAHHLGRKIFLYNQVPHYNEARWAHEVMIMQPTIINGDLDKIT